MKWKIPLFKIYNDDDDIIHITNVIKRGSYWATGNSGTSALHALLLAYGIKKGKNYNKN